MADQSLQTWPAAADLHREGGDPDGDDAVGRHALPPVLGGRYRIEADLGGGAASRVVRAHDDAVGRDVAIKVLSTPIASLDRLTQDTAEGRLLGSLNHPSLTTLHDIGVDRSDPDRPLVFLVLEHVPGPDLRQRLQSGALDPLEVCWLGYDLSDGLAHLHAAGYLHRDVKPANVLLVRRGPSMRIGAKLADFGLSSLVSSPHTPGLVVGTAAYIAPEQVQDRPSTEASDVYALGLVLIEALTGDRVYPGPIDDSVVARLHRQPGLPDGLAAPLADLLRSMTARDPAQRPSATEAAVRFRDLATTAPAERRSSSRLEAEREAERLAAVHRYRVLDTPPEDAFDDVTALVSRVLRVPVAVVSIVDADRVWFKSRHDLDEVQIDRRGELWIVRSPDGRPWSIVDAAQDPRTRDHPIVTGGPRIRGCAGAPLRTHDGHELGALCALDPQPHRFTEDDLAILTALAAVVMRDLELRLASRRAVFSRRAAEPPLRSTSKDPTTGGAA